MKKTRAATYITEWHEKYFERCLELPPNPEARGCASCEFGRTFTVYLELSRGPYQSQTVPARLMECSLLRHFVDRPE